ncbi:MAG: NYN domain-containing protein [Galbitalea sp.]
MFRLPDITHVVIVAGDSDFIPLAQSCKRLGRYVVGIGVAGASSKSLAAACNEFKFYGELPGVVPGQGPGCAGRDGRRTGRPETPDTAPGIQGAGTAEIEIAETVDPKLSATELLVRALRVGHATSDDEWLQSGGSRAR